MKLFPVFPVLFPVCSQSQTNEFLVFPVFRISSQDPYGYSGLVIAIFSTTRNIGNIRNMIEASRVGLGVHVEQAGNTGNSQAGLRKQSGA
jgi:hypothetical protein